MKIFTKQTLFTLIKPLLPQNPLIVEAGAFDGKDTKRMAEFWPQATLHTFEPVSDIFKTLKTNTSLYPRITCYNCALSNATGSALFYHATKPSHPDQLCQAGSLLQPKERLNWSPIVYNKIEHVQTITLDEWATEQKINKIDLLWLDVQGYALPILQAASTMLKTIQVVHLEVEFIEAYEGQAQYQEVKEWLEQQGFVEQGRDFTNTTDWFFGNVLFVRIQKKIKALTKNLNYKLY